MRDQARQQRPGHNLLTRLDIHASNIPTKRSRDDLSNAHIVFGPFLPDERNGIVNVGNISLKSELSFLALSQEIDSLPVQTRLGAAQRLLLPAQGQQFRFGLL